MTNPTDPLANIVFLKIPEELAVTFTGHIPPSLLVPCERLANSASPPAITIEAIIAGMLRVLMYRPDHDDNDTYRTIVRELRPNIKEEFTQAGRLKAGLKDFPIAIEIFMALTALFPECGVCAFNLALVYHDAALHCQKDPEHANRAADYLEQAFTAYRSALTLDEVLPDTYLNYAYFLLEQENYEKALVHFEEYLRREKDETKMAPIRKIVSDLSVFQEQDGLFKEAFDNIALGKEEDGILQAAALLQQHPDFWNAWFLHGWGLRRLCRYEEAKESFLKALSLAPPKSDLLNELAIVHMELGELEDSYRRLTEALKIEPENVKVLSNLGVVCFKMNRHDESAGFFKTVMEYSGDDPVAQNYLKILEKK
jgi:tetratricopeptide (TPR) repeat protein